MPLYRDLWFWAKFAGICLILSRISQTWGEVKSSPHTDHQTYLSDPSGKIDRNRLHWESSSSSNTMSLSSCPSNSCLSNLCWRSSWVTSPALARPTLLYSPQFWPNSTQLGNNASSSSFLFLAISWKSFCCKIEFSFMRRLRKIYLQINHFFWTFLNLHPEFGIQQYWTFPKWD